MSRYIASCQAGSPTGLIPHALLVLLLSITVDHLHPTLYLLQP
jgi:hypothetical protein